MTEPLGLVQFCVTDLAEGFVGNSLSYSWQKGGKVPKKWGSVSADALASVLTQLIKINALKHLQNGRRCFHSQVSPSYSGAPEVRGVSCSSLTHCFLVVGQVWPVLNGHFSPSLSPIYFRYGLKQENRNPAERWTLQLCWSFLLFLVCQMDGIVNWLHFSMPVFAVLSTGVLRTFLLLSLSPTHSKLPLVPCRPFLLTNEKLQT